MALTKRSCTCQPARWRSGWIHDFGPKYVCPSQRVLSKHSTPLQASVVPLESWYILINQIILIFEIVTVIQLFLQLQLFTNCKRCYHVVAHASRYNTIKMTNGIRNVSHMKRGNRWLSAKRGRLRKKERKRKVRKVLKFGIFARLTKLYYQNALHWVMVRRPFLLVIAVSS